MRSSQISGGINFSKWKSNISDLCAELFARSAFPRLPAASPSFNDLHDSHSISEIIEQVFVSSSGHQGWQLSSIQLSNSALTFGPILSNSLLGCGRAFGNIWAIFVPQICTNRVLDDFADYQAFISPLATLVLSPKDSRISTEYLNLDKVKWDHQVFNYQSEDRLTASTIFACSSLNAHHTLRRVFMLMPIETVFPSLGLTR